MTEDRLKKLNEAVDTLKRVINSDNVTFTKIQIAIDKLEHEFNTIQNQIQK